MLSCEALKAAYPLTELLDAAGFKVVSKLNSPLDFLCGRTPTSAEIGYQVNDIGDVAFDLELIEHLTSTPMLPPNAAEDVVTRASDHDVALDSIAELYQRVVQDHINVARTMVNPLIVDLADSVLQDNANVKTSELLGFEIIPQPVPKPYLNNTLARMVDNYETANRVGIYGNRIAAERSQEELLDDIKTGSGELDADVLEWVSTHPKGLALLSEVWNTIFRQQDGGRFNDYISSRGDGADRALIVFLLARKLADHPLDDSGVTLVQWNNTMADYRDAAASFVAVAMGAATKETKNGMMIRGHSGKRITVFEPVYRTFLEKGGNNEMLFANLLSDQPKYTVDDILERSETLMAAWQRFAAIDDAASQIRRRARVKDSFYRHFNRQLGEMKDEDPGMRMNLDTEGVLKLFQHVIEGLSSYSFDIENVYYTAQKLICRTRFVRTAAESILTDIDLVKKNNPNLPIREVTAIAAINYITDWLFDQLKVKGINE